MNNELVVIEQANVMTVFTEGDQLDEIIKQVEMEIATFEHDLSTGVGRKKTASLANKVAKTKTYLDGLGKDLVSDWKTKAKVVDGNRKSMRDRLDELKSVARQPLTEWEEEQAKIEAEEAARIEAEKVAVEIERDHELALLMNAEFDRVAAEKAAEAKRIEDERLAKEETDRIAREEKIKREAAEKAQREAEEKAKAEQERVEREKREAIEREEAAKAEAERQRQAAIQAEIDLENEREAAAKLAEENRLAEIEREKQRKIDEENRLERERVAKAEVEARAKRDSEAAAERARLAEIQRQEAAAAEEKRQADAREANRQHVGKVRKAAKEALMAAGLDEESAKKAVLAISKNQVPNVQINY